MTQKVSPVYYSGCDLGGNLGEAKTNPANRRTAEEQNEKKCQIISGKTDLESNGPKLDESRQEVMIDEHGLQNV